MYRLYCRELKLRVTDGGLVPGSSSTSETSTCSQGSVLSNNQKLVKEDELARNSSQQQQLPPPPLPQPPPPPQVSDSSASGSAMEQTQQNSGDTLAANDPAKPKIPLTEQQKKEFQEYLAREKARVDGMMAQIEAMLLAATPSGALHGSVKVKCPSDAKIVRIFTSSTFTDTKHERNYLMRHAYPQLKHHCQQIGYEFQVVDMRWGVREEAADDHMASELCLKELKLCQEISTGPNFVSLLSHKYGYTPFPRLIEASEFEALMRAIQDDHILALFKKWYTRDDNAMPPEYVLSPISTHLPAFIGNNLEEKKAAKETWWKENEIMQVALEQSALKVFDEQKARKFIMSVTENEVKHGLLDLKDPSKQCLWLKRDIVDIQNQEKNYQLSRFTECLGPEEKYTKAQTLLKGLKDERMSKSLNKDNVLEYCVHWNKDGGINPESSEEHKKYLETMSDDFTQHMIGMINGGVKAKVRKEDRVLNECFQHISFCQNKCESFHGREETIEKIKNYVTAVNTKKEPLVIHGQSGSGKTSIMAMVAKLAADWVKPAPLILFRFLGTTQDSSSLMALLYSMTSQLERSLNQPVRPPTENIEVQKARFWLNVHRYQAKKPLIIILDSLDQLDVAYDARKLLWMPAVLAKGTIILSTLEEPQYECFPALQKLVTEPSNFIRIPTLSRDNSSQILSSWFDMHKRMVTDKQMDMLLNAFDKCSTPLFLKLSFDEAIRWTSYISVDQMVLRDTVRASIDHLFERMEKLHGKILFSRSLAYLTLAKNGSSEVEMEDILSCDDDVLNDVYMYWTPPMRRLPPLLLVRIRTDLSQYLVERGADGVQVLYWYHRQFIEAAKAKYCVDAETLLIIHQNLSDFFAGTWANGKKKPFTNKDGINLEEDRYVAAQPLVFGEGKYNLRKLNNLPYHCCRSGNVDMLLQQCLANIEFLRTKLDAVGFISVIEDYKMANKMFPDNELISSILAVMQLSHKGLQMDAGQIVPQMLQRLSVSADTSAFLQQCREYQAPYIEPSMQLLDLPGGQLVHTISTHKGDVDMIDMTTDGKVIVTVCQENKEVFLWNVDEATKIRAVSNPGQCTEAYFCMNNNGLALEKSNIIYVEDVHSGRKIMQFPKFKSAWCVAGIERDTVVVFKMKDCNIHDLNNNGDIEGTVSLNAGEKRFGELSVTKGTPNFVAVTDTDQYFISILDLRNKKFFSQFRGFPKVQDEDGDWEEHEVEAMCFAHDESCLVYTNMFTGEVLFVDFAGTKLRSIPANEDRSYTFLELSPDGTQLFLASDATVYIISYQTLQEVDVIEHVSSVKKIKMMNPNNMITISEDSNLRLWDRTREKLQVKEKDTFLKHVSIRKNIPLENPRYILMYGLLNDKAKQSTVIVYDIFKEVIIKEFNLKVRGEEQTKVGGIYKTNMWNKVIMNLERKLYLVNLDTMTIEITTDGHLNRSYHSHHQNILLTANNEMVCSTKGSMNLKLYDLLTGKVTKVVKAGQEKKIEAVVINKLGTVVAARTFDDIILLFDVVSCKHLYNIDDKEKYNSAGYSMLFNGTGAILMFTISEALKEFKEKTDVEQVICWDIQNRKEIGRMVDIEYEKKYRQTANKDKVGETAVSELHTLDEKRAITLGYDDIIRIHEINTGQLLHRLEGHYSTPKIYIEEKSPYILTHGFMDNEGTLRLWDKQTYQCLASFTLEKDVNNIAISSDGKFFTSTLQQTAQQPYSLVHWRIHQTQYDVTVNQEDYPEDFSSKAVGDDLIFDKTVTPVQQDPNDVDSDPDVDSDDGDDDDDDDSSDEKHKAEKD